MKSTLFFSFVCMAVSVVSCDNAGDSEVSLKDRKHQEICQNFFVPDFIPARVTEPYVIIRDSFNFSLIDTTNFEIFRSLSYSGHEGVTYYASNQSLTRCFEGLYNHTTYTYQTTLETWDNCYNRKRYECKPVSFTVDIDEEALAVTEEQTANITTNSATLSAHFNISPEHADKYAYFIYTSETPDIQVRDGILYSLNGHKLNLDGEYHGSFKFDDLLYNTTYYYQACVRHILDGMSYGATYRGAVKSFTTPPLKVSVTVCDFKGKVPVGPLTITYHADVKDAPSTDLMEGIIYSATNKEPTVDGDDCHDGFIFGGDETTIVGLAPGTVYYYRAYAKHPYSTGYYYSEVKTFETEDLNVSPEGTDLGLSVIWAGCNVGATSPEQYGNYYNFGGKGCTSTGVVIDSIQCTDGWRLPTENEFMQLLRCKQSWINYKGSYGILIEGQNGASIFFPASYIATGEFSTTKGGYWAKDNHATLDLYEGGMYLARTPKDYFLSVRLVHDK